MLRETKKNFLIDLLFFITVGALIYFGFKFLAAYLFPFVIGLILTVLVQKPAVYVSEKTKLKKGLCALIFVLLSYLLVITLIGLLGYFVYSQGSKIVNALPSLLQEFSATLNSLGSKVEELSVSMPDELQSSISNMFNNLISGITTSVTGWISGFAASLAKYAPGFLIGAVVTIVASCYIAKDYENFKKLLRRWIKQKHLDTVSEVKNIVFVNVFRIIRGYLIMMAITFAELSIGLMIIGIKNVFLLALLISFVDLLPVLGTGTVLIPWGIISLLQGNIGLGIGLLIIYVVVLIIRNMLEPKIIGDQVGLHPLITLLTIFIGLRLFGIIGMFAFPIITIILYQFYKSGRLEFLVLNKNE